MNENESANQEISRPSPAQDPKSVPQQVKEKLSLPKGALIAMRKSGGIKFSTREVVVYPDGRVIYLATGHADEDRKNASRKMNDAQIMQIRRTLERINFFRMKSAEGEQKGDVFAIEIAARLSNRSNYVEVFTGVIPESLAALIEQLSKLMPQSE